MLRRVVSASRTTCSTVFFTFYQANVKPELIKRASDMLEKGYKRLIGFETDTRGFEWFGKAPGHEALTAYGLAQFMDMKKVLDVDASLVDRTHPWFLGRLKDDKSGFLRNSKALDSFGRASEATTDAYIVW